MRDEKPPPATGASFVWLLLDPAPLVGHRLVVGAYSSLGEAEAARAAVPYTLSLHRVGLDRPPGRT